VDGGGGGKEMSHTTLRGGELVEGELSGKICPGNVSRGEYPDPRCNVMDLKTKANIMQNTARKNKNSPQGVE